MLNPYYQDDLWTQYCGDALGVLPELSDESVDLLVTDPPYGISFMGKEWDKALPDKRIWQECFRVLRVTKKPDKVEYMTIVKMSGLGIIIIGLVGFTVSMLKILMFP